MLKCQITLVQELPEDDFHGQVEFYEIEGRREKLMVNVKYIYT